MLLKTRQKLGNVHSPRGQLQTLLVLFLTVLTSCGQEPQTNPPTFRITAVQPTNPTPGQGVTVFGNLPSAAAVTLKHQDNPAEQLTLQTRNIVGGVEFELPSNISAGAWTLMLEAGTARLNAELLIQPRIDRAVWATEPSRLFIYGAGWSPSQQDSQSTTIEVWLEGTRLTGTVQDGVLSVTLPAQPTSSNPLDQPTVYGSSQVRVVVNGQSSAPYTILREAGAVRGQVSLPGNAESESISSSLSLLQATPTPAPLPSLVVNHTIGFLPTLMTLVNPSKTTTLPTNTVTISRLDFDSLEQARAALNILHQRNEVTSVAFDQPINLGQSQTTLYASPPASPGAGQWHLSLLGLPEVWQQTRGEGVVVAVVDTGVVLEHPDLRNRLVPGFDFVDMDSSPADTNGHGTHVAGLVGANGLVLGAAPSSRIQPVRVLEGTTSGSAFTVAQGILWSAGALNRAGCDASSPPSPSCNPTPAQIINLSLGTSEFSQPLSTAVQQAQQQGVLVAAAAGNDGGNALNYPAALAGVLSVTALAGPQSTYQPSYATRGPGLRLSAFGGDTTQDQDGNGQPDGILSTDLSDAGLAGYAQRMGTSMASPLVAGIAALALASGTPKEGLAQTLLATAIDMGILGYDTRFGFGLVSAKSGQPTRPRTYVVALDERDAVKGWALVDQTLRFTVNNLPTNQPLKLLALSDLDNDLVLGEAGELSSPAVRTTPRAGKINVLPSILTLSPSSGVTVVSLR